VSQTANTLGYFARNKNKPNNSLHNQATQCNQQYYKDQDHWNTRQFAHTNNRPDFDNLHQSNCLTYQTHQRQNQNYYSNNRNEPLAFNRNNHNQMCDKETQCEQEDRVSQNIQPPVKIIPPRHKYTFEELAINLEECKLSSENKDKLKDLITEYGDIFAKNLLDLGTAKGIEHEIELIPGSQPVTQRPYRYNAADRLEIQKQTKSMLEAGIIRESTSEFSSPIVLVTKKERTKMGNPK
jgi:hypothetical protein